MGTSASYPGSPNWGNVKGDATSASGDGGATTEEVGELFSDFVSELCESDNGIGELPSDYGTDDEKAKEKLQEVLESIKSRPAPTKGRGSGGGGAGASENDRVASGSGRKGGSGGGGGRSGGASRILGRGIQPTAQRVASFISEVPRFGLRDALEGVGLGELADASPDQIALALVDVLCGPQSLIVDAEIRDATAALLDDTYGDVETIEDLESAITQSSGNLHDILLRLFENYIVERFKTVLSEHLSKRFSYDAADKLVAKARDYVSTEMKLLASERPDLSEVDWAGSEGRQIVDAILEETVAVHLA